MIPLSGQAITHFQNRRDRGMGDLNPLIDENAPLYFVRGDCIPHTGGPARERRR